MRKAILVNGVPASGKSTVSRAVARRLCLPLMTLDTVKEPMFHHIGKGDRDHNRKLGRASYEIIFAVIGDWPADATVVIDAWFGFQPPDVLERHLSTAGIAQHGGALVPRIRAGPGRALSVAGGDAIRGGHPGPEYVPELLALNARAMPIGRGPCLHVDTTAPLDPDAVMAWISEAFRTD